MSEPLPKFIFGDCTLSISPPLKHKWIERIPLLGESSI